VPSLAKPSALLDPDWLESIMATMWSRRYSLGATVSNYLVEIENALAEKCAAFR
jgi:hypothetical protein